jgi:RNA polymerase sigma-70 factor (ECF subfamily)
MSEIRPLLEQYLPHLRRYARALTRDADRADDLVQACLVRALANQHLWHEGTDLRAWLFTILHNQHINELRSQARQQKLLQQAQIAPALLPGSDPELSHRVQELAQVLRKLPVRQGEIVLRISLEQQTYGDAAVALRIPIGTVRSRFSRARERLRAITDGS